jgi:hypothetical protein
MAKESDEAKNELAKENTLLRIDDRPIHHRGLAGCRP